MRLGARVTARDSRARVVPGTAHMARIEIEEIAQACEATMEATGLGLGVVDQIPKYVVGVQSTKIKPGTGLSFALTVGV